MSNATPLLRSSSRRSSRAPRSRDADHRARIAGRGCRFARPVWMELPAHVAVQPLRFAPLRRAAGRVLVRACRCRMARSPPTTSTASRQFSCTTGPTALDRALAPTRAPHCDHSTSAPLRASRATLHAQVIAVDDSWAPRGDPSRRSSITSRPAGWRTSRRRSTGRRSRRFNLPPAARSRWSPKASGPAQNSADSFSVGVKFLCRLGGRIGTRTAAVTNVSTPRPPPSAIRC